MSAAARLFSIYFADNIAIADWVGVVTAEAIRASYEEMMAQPSFRYGMPLMAIVNPSVSLPTTDELVSFVPEMVAFGSCVGPLALVVHSDIHMGLARMLSAYSHMSGLNVEVFTSVEAADDWLQFQTGRKPPSGRRTKASGRLVGPL
jgi:hypothetical protein